MVVTVDEAQGMLPRHPNCRCAWIPHVPEMVGNARLLANCGGKGGRPGPCPSAAESLRSIPVPVARADRLRDDQLFVLSEELKAAPPLFLRRIEIQAGRAEHGQHDPVSGTLKLSAAALDQGSLTKALRERGASIVDETPRGVINHELGHALVAKVGLPDALSSDPGVVRWSRTLSGQAAIDKHEAAAEWYAAARAGKPFPLKV